MALRFFLTRTYGRTALVACKGLANYRVSPRFSESTRRRSISTSTTSDVTEVERTLLSSIKATGPIPISTYMTMCLSHPTHGYYMNKENSIFGTKGDFITSPEISQAFGELVAVWLLTRWQAAGRPHNIRLVELGPGRGTMMDDILRVILIFARTSFINVHLIETSSSMRSMQDKALRHFTQRPNIKLHWHNSIANVAFDPSQFTMIVAHEFFDALPIHVLQKTETGWHEVLVASSEQAAITGEPQNTSRSSTSSSTRFRRVISPTPTAASTLLGLSSSRFNQLPIGSSVEVSPTSFRTARQIGELLTIVNTDASKEMEMSGNSLGGCGLIFDYGGDKVYGESIRAFRQHKIVDIFYKPGECDITANVDFAYLREAVADLVTTHGPIAQHIFLERMGLQPRIDALVKGAQTEERRTAIKEAGKRLVDRTGMGTEYRVMGITGGVNTKVDQKFSTKASEGKESQENDVWPFVEVAQK